jgi:hypothetical protein
MFDFTELRIVNQAIESFILNFKPYLNNSSDSLLVSAIPNWNFTTPLGVKSW